MKLITTIVRPERLPEVKAALFRAGVTGITLSRVSGHGGEQEVIGQYRGTTVVMEFHEKVKIEMVCSEPFVEPCIKAIRCNAPRSRARSTPAPSPARRTSDHRPAARRRRRRLGR